MNVHTLMTLVMVGGGLVIAVSVLRQIGRGLTALFEALATVATIVVALWWTGKAVVFVVKSAVTHPRTTVGTFVVVLWLCWWGWLSLVIAASAAGVGLVVWWWRDRLTYEQWIGRRLRSWWLRWAGRSMPAGYRAGCRPVGSRCRTAISVSCWS